MEDHGLSAVKKCTFGVHEVFFHNASWGSPQNVVTNGLINLGYTVLFS